MDNISRYIFLVNDMCCVRIMTNNTNEYRQVKIHRKKKSNQDNVGMFYFYIF